MSNRTAAAKLAVSKGIRGHDGRWEYAPKTELGGMLAGDRPAAQHVSLPKPTQRVPYVAPPRHYLNAYRDLGDTMEAVSDRPL